MAMETVLSETLTEKLAPARDHWKAKNRYYYDYMEKNLMPFLVPSDKRVLEIGCGTGDLLASAAPAAGVGIDHNPELIARANDKYGKQSNLRFIVSDAEKDDWSKLGQFDVVVISDVVGYLTDIETLFQRLHAVTTPASRIIITQYNQLWEPLLNLASRLGQRMPTPLQNWLSGYDITNLLHLAGFEKVTSGRKLLLPKNIPLLGRFLNKFVANLPLVNRLNLVNYIVARPMPAVTPLATLASSAPKRRQPSVSIVVPACNEAGMIEKIANELPTLPGKTELIFVEGNSTDNTWAEIQRVAESYSGPHTIKYAQQVGRGKGDAVRQGFAMAEGDILMIYDADMTVPAWEIPKFYQAIVSWRGEFINGSRLVYPMEKQSMRTINYLGNKFFSVTFSWLLGQKIKDTLCGTKVLWRKDYEDIAKGRGFFGEFDPFGDFDLLFGAAKLNLKIVDLPVHYKERTYGTTNISRWKHGWLLLKMMWFAMCKIKFI